MHEHGSSLGALVMALPAVVVVGAALAHFALATLRRRRGDEDGPGR